MFNRILKTFKRKILQRLISSGGLAKMINKLSMKSKDIISDNVNKISEIFPNCVSEGKINFEMLKQELSKDIIEEGKEFR